MREKLEELTLLLEKFKRGISHMTKKGSKRLLEMIEDAERDLSTAYSMDKQSPTNDSKIRITYCAKRLSDLKTIAHLEGVVI